MAAIFLFIYDKNEVWFEKYCNVLLWIPVTDMVHICTYLPMHAQKIAEMKYAVQLVYLFSEYVWLYHVK